MKMPPGLSLYLVRHGIAAQRGDQWPDDSKRPLVPRGVARLRRAAAALQALDVRFDVVLTSPLVRARQTAETLAAGLSPRPTVQVTDALSPGAPYASFLDSLAKHAHGGVHVACVGHEPDIGQLAARLIGAKQPIAFKKGAICRIDLNALPVTGPGHLRWFIAPRILRRLRT